MPEQKFSAVTRYRATVYHNCKQMSHPWNPVVIFPHLIIAYGSQLQNKTCLAMPAAACGRTPFTTHCCTSKGMRKHGPTRCSCGQNVMLGHKCSHNGELGLL